MTAIPDTVLRASIADVDTRVAAGRVLKKATRTSGTAYWIDKAVTDKTQLVVFRGAMAIVDPDNIISLDQATPAAGQTTINFQNFAFDADETVYVYA
jgi:hypothetical protein